MSPDLHRVATVLEIMGLGKCQEKKRKRVEIVREKSGNFDSLSLHNSFITPQVQLDDLSFC